MRIFGVLSIAVLVQCQCIDAGRAKAFTAKGKEAARMTNNSIFNYLVPAPLPPPAPAPLPPPAPAPLPPPASTQSNSNERVVERDLSDSCDEEENDSSPIPPVPVPSATASDSSDSDSSSESAQAMRTLDLSRNPLVRSADAALNDQVNNAEKKRRKSGESLLGGSGDTTNLFESDASTSATVSTSAIAHSTTASEGSSSSGNDHSAGSSDWEQLKSNSNNARPMENEENEEVGGGGGDERGFVESFTSNDLSLLSFDLDSLRANDEHGDLGTYSAIDQHGRLAKVFRNSGDGGCLFHSIGHAIRDHLLLENIDVSDIRNLVLANAVDHLDDVFVGRDIRIDNPIRGLIEDLIRIRDDVRDDDPMANVSDVEEFLTLFSEPGTFTGDMSLALASDFVARRFGLSLAIYVVVDGAGDVDNESIIRFRHLHTLGENNSGAVNVLWNGSNHYEAFEFDDSSTLQNEVPILQNNQETATAVSSSNQTSICLDPSPSSSLSSTSSSLSPSSSSSLSSTSSSLSPPTTTTIRSYNDFTQEEIELIFHGRTRTGKKLSFAKIATKIGRGCAKDTVNNYCRKNSSMIARIEAANEPVPSDLSIARRDSDNNIIPIVNSSNVRVWTTEEDNMIVNSYNNREPWHVVATVLTTTEDILRARVNNVLQDRVNGNLRGTRRVRNPRTFTDTELEAIVESHNNGVSRADLCIAYGCSYDEIRRALRLRECTSEGCSSNRYIGEYCQSCSAENEPDAHRAFCDRENELKRRRYATDLGFKAVAILRSRLAAVFKKLGLAVQQGKTEAVGCTSAQLSRYIQQQMTGPNGWMSLENHGVIYAIGESRTWQLDHIFPITEFVRQNLSELTLPEIMRRVNNWSNLMPLDSRVNNQKKAGIPQGFHWDNERERWVWEEWTGNVNFELPEEDEEEEEEEEE